MSQNQCVALIPDHIFEIITYVGVKSKYIRDDVLFVVKTFVINFCNISVCCLTMPIQASVQFHR